MLLDVEADTTLWPSPINSVGTISFADDLGGGLPVSALLLLLTMPKPSPDAVQALAIASSERIGRRRPKYLPLGGVSTPRSKTVSCRCGLSHSSVSVVPGIGVPGSRIKELGGSRNGLRLLGSAVSIKGKYVPNSRGLPVNAMSPCGSVSMLCIGSIVRGASPAAPKFNVSSGAAEGMLMGDDGRGTRAAFPGDPPKDMLGVLWRISLMLPLMLLTKLVCLRCPGLWKSGELRLALSPELSYLATSVRMLWMLSRFFATWRRRVDMAPLPGRVWARSYLGRLVTLEVLLSGDSRISSKSASSPFCGLLGHQQRTPQREQDTHNSAFSSAGLDVPISVRAPRCTMSRRLPNHDRFFVSDRLASRFSRVAWAIDSLVPGSRSNSGILLSGDIVVKDRSTAQSAVELGQL